MVTLHTLELRKRERHERNKAILYILVCFGMAMLSLYGVLKTEEATALHDHQRDMMTQRLIDLPH